MTLPMSRRVALYSVRLAMVVAGLLLLLAVAYFARGSLEEFPTAEQQNKIRVLTAVLAVVLAGIELALWRLSRYLSR